jgi:hypothetical protein
MQEMTGKDQSGQSVYQRMSIFCQHTPLMDKAKTGFEARPHHRVRLPSSLIYKGFSCVS